MLWNPQIVQNTLRKLLCCVDTNSSNWQDVQSSWGRQGVPACSVLVLWHTSLQVSDCGKSANCTALKTTSAVLVGAVDVMSWYLLSFRGNLYFCSYGCVHTLYCVYSFIFYGLSYKNSISASRHILWEKNLWIYGNCIGFHNGSPPDLHMLTTVIFIFNEERISSVSHLVLLFLFLFVFLKSRSIIALKIEASWVFISKGLGLFQVTVEVWLVQ